MTYNAFKVSVFIFLILLISPLAHAQINANLLTRIHDGDSITMNSIVDVLVGSLFYNTTNQSLHVHNGTVWSRLNSGSYGNMAGNTDETLNTNVRAGINVDGSVPNSTLEVDGSFATAITTTSSSITLDETHHTLILTSSYLFITLPAASSCRGRIYLVKKTVSGTTYISTYRNATGAKTGTITGTDTFRFQSDGYHWHLI